MSDPVYIPPVPNPPPPQTRRFDGQGRPTTAQVEYEQRQIAWMKAVTLKLASL